MRTVWTSIVSSPREMMSSIPSTIVRPLHDKGTPAGPSFTGIIDIPAGTGQGTSYDNPFPLAVRKNLQFLGPTQR